MIQGLLKKCRGVVLRKNILDIISSADINVEKEYSRIYDIFYHTPFNDGFNKTPIAVHVAANFMSLDKKLIGRCLSIEDFNETYGFCFVQQPKNFDVDYLISFSEYVTNLVYAYIRSSGCSFNHEKLIDIIEHIRECMEDIGYELVEKDSIVIYVEKNSAAISVAEIVGEDLSYSILEYNHHRLKGDLISKKNILMKMAEDIEIERKELNNINKSFTSDLFQLMNKFIRHNNSDNIYISQMSDSELEKVYDEIYQMWLLAKMKLEHAKRSGYISELIKDINV